VALTLLVLIAAGCRGNGELGPAESYRLFAPSGGGGELVVRALPLDAEPALTLGRVLNDGFAAEMVRTVHLAKQWVRHQRKDGGPYPADAWAAANQPLCLVVGRDASAASHRGLALEGTFGGPKAQPQLRWVGLSGNVEGDKALVQSVTGRLAAHAADWIATGAAGEPSSSLVLAYAGAMEVIAREWRAGVEGRALPSTVGTLEQRKLFAAVRENQGVLTGDGQGLRPAAEIVADPIVGATTIYRLAQTRAIAHSAGPAELYTPFVAHLGPLPAGVLPAQVLGPVRNFQAKLLSAWGKAVADGHPPRDIVDLITAYGALFPAEKAEVDRIFLATSFGATVIPGGVSRDPAEASRAVARLAELAADLSAGRRGLRDAVTAGQR
jgi:hypothetical protein